MIHIAQQQGHTTIVYVNNIEGGRIRRISATESPYNYYEES